MSFGPALGNCWHPFSVASVPGGINELVGSARALLGLTRPGRLRDQLDNTLDLYAKAMTHPELEDATQNLGLIVTLQTKRLLSIHQPETRRKWQWQSCLAGLFLTAVVAVPIYILWRARDNQPWLMWPLLILDALIVILFFLTSMSVLLEREAISNDAA